MTDNRLRDDENFRDELNAAAEDVVDALMNELFPKPTIIGAITDFVFDDWSPLPDGPHLPRDSIEESKEYWHTLFKQFRGRNITSGTEKIGSTLNLDMVGAMKKVAGIERGDFRSTEKIFNELIDWTGPPGSAAFTFKFEYLDDLNESLLCLLNVAQSLNAIMLMHEAVVLAAREGILTIADRTLERLGELKQARAASDTKFVQDIADAALSAVTSEAQPGARVTTAFTSVGHALRDWDVQGSGFDEVSASMQEAIADLCSAVRADEEQVRKALNDVMEYVYGEHRFDALPPDVNLP